MLQPNSSGTPVLRIPGRDEQRSSEEGVRRRPGRDRKRTPTADCRDCNVARARLVLLRVRGLRSVVPFETRSRPEGPWWW